MQRVQFLHKCNRIWTYERNILSGLLEPSIRDWLWDQAWHWKIAWPSFWRQKLLIGVLSKSLQSRLDYEMSRSLASRSCVTGWSPELQEGQLVTTGSCVMAESQVFMRCVNVSPQCLSPGLIATRLLLSVTICSEECNWVGLIKYIVSLY